ncbi:gliding motility-associated ABC transporter substrate-binding protein GldG [Lentiprolixibacter aurantiacus]|uniref:Gliding motility-associated ABC transporter substrate-binding protein GldG n=1 Tax=Lentiprolixibacter aurantiacus TaxID=2993939 RepID=A0AAE3MMW7_9FLAO|nr:gliding motility-associated ABC transporter substrate-binding protein GldG [Lentiprolixibacter aurantiacus]MCX2719814.1 gliding motility-associated ABC transporter substrate-binding protein GldG [Lentiprolixibacter aurantiacus]
MGKGWIKSGITVILGVILLNFLATHFYLRFDLTEDQRYTLSEAAGDAVQKLEGEVMVDVLLDGDLPPEFLRLQKESRQILEEFAEENPGLIIDYVNPLEEETDIEATIAQLQGLGLTPVNITVENTGKTTQELLFPWALVTHKERTVKVPLLKNKLGASTEDRINNSVQNLEYAFSDAFYKLGIKDKKRIAVLKGNGELPDAYMADFLTTIQDYYNIGAITLDSVASNPEGTLDILKQYDLALIAKPTEAFTDGEKYLLDQYMVNGGRSIWLVDPVVAELDSLFNNEGKSLAYIRDLNIDDLLFRYGVRVNPNLVNDLYFTQVVLASGEGNDAQYNPVPWFYHPMVFSQENHPVNSNIEALRFQFASVLDTLSNTYKKTVLLQSSPLSKADGVPRTISLDMITSEPDRETYKPGGMPLAVLVEGEFKSAYVNRIRPIKLSSHQDQGPQNKMIVIGDGDLIRNQMRNGRPLELGYDKWTNNFYGNKEFLINCLNYMLEDTGLINIRAKEINIPLLDQEKIAQHKTKWQLINIGLPLLATLLFGLIFNVLRRRKYAR